MNRESRSVDRLLTVGDLAELLQVPTSWVYERIRNGAVNRIPGYKLGKYWRFRESEVLDWLELQKSKACAD